MAQRILPGNWPNCIVLDSWAFDSFILTDKLFTKVKRRFTTCLWGNNNLYEKWVSSSELFILFDVSLKTISV